jgi:hypothetical protein
VWTSVGFSIKGLKKPSQVPRLDLSQNAAKTTGRTAAATLILRSRALHSTRKADPEGPSIGKTNALSAARPTRHNI